MKKSITILLCVSLAAAVAMLAIYASRQKAPFYAGRPLNYWVHEFRAGGPRREKAEAAFRAMGTNAVPFLIAALNKKESFFHRNYAAVVRRLPAAVQPLFLRSREAPEFLRARAAVTLADMRAPATSNTVAALRRAVDDPFFGARNNAVVAIGNTAPKTSAAAQAVAALIHATKDTNFMVRANAYWQLGKFLPEASEAIPVLQRGLSDPESRVRTAAEHGLSLIGVAPTSNTGTNR